MKHYMLPRTPFLRDANPSSVELPPPSPNPTPQKQQKSNRKQRSFSKENADPNTLPDSGNNSAVGGKQSPAQSTKTKSPLPPRPPNPLKRKLSVDAILADVVGPCPATDSGVKVVVRMRPLSKDEDDTDMIVQKLSDESLTINGQTFTFDSVADTASSQLDIFQHVGAPLVENCLAGFNSSVFAYGQTGSGKTYTMWGPPNSLLEQDLLNDQLGLTPRVFERLLARIDEEQIKHADKQLKYQCRCSFLEIYNEQITDLLEPSQKNLQIREDVKSGVYVENLTEEYVSCMKDVVQLLLKGLSNRRIGSTSINAESSRSHSVFTCVVESRSKSKADGLSSFKTSRINLVDLAGSERQKSTGAAGERLKEAGNINRSLSQLGNLINILAEVSQNGKQRHIPYRDSRLTFLLQESLGGNAKLAMICAVSPAQRCKSETFSTLRFAQRAKAIKNKAVVNEVMQDDVNSLREMIRQLKDELFRMKAHGGQSDPNGAYSNGWSARRSLNLLKFSLSRPTTLNRLDDDGDELMDIDEETVEKLCVQAGLQLATDANKSGLVEAESESVESPGEQTCEHLRRSTSRNEGIQREVSDASDSIMSEGTSEMDDKEDDTSGYSRTNATAEFPGQDGSAKDGNCSEKDECPINEPSKDLTDSVNKVIVSFHKDEESPPATLRSSLIDSASPNLIIVPCDASPALQSPSPSVSPRVSSSGRKSLRTSSTLTASQKDLKDADDARTSMAKPTKQSNSKSPNVTSSKSNLSGIQNLAASIHHGLEIIDSHMQTSPLRRSPYRFSLKPADLKPSILVERADVGVQTIPEEAELPAENRGVYICSNCMGTSTPPDGPDRADEDQNLQLVPLGGSPSAEKATMMLPKAVEKVLAGAIRREMALEEYGAHQTSEITQLKRLVQQYKHERQCNAIIAQIRDEKISRLEHFMDGVFPSDEFIEEELLFLKREHELLKEKCEHHPEVLDTKLQLQSVQNELERYKNFFDMGERDVLVEEIQDLRSQLQYYSDHSRKTHGQSSPLQLTYPSEPTNSSTPLNTISTSMEENSAEKKLEEERNHWTEMESKWISLTEELRADLDASHSTAQKLTKQLDSEKKCSEELKEALQLAMEGHARMLEQYADLEERHMEMLARHRQMQDGIADVKKAAARAGVSRAESKFINFLANEISALKVEREKERRYLRDENRMLQSQLRDTAEAVQAAGELLVRLKEAEEAVSAAQKRSTKAEEETDKLHKQIEKLKKKHEKEVCALNQIIAESSSRISKEDGEHFDSNPSSTPPTYDEPEHGQSCEDDRWKEAFAGFYNENRDTEEVSKFDGPSWFAGYDRCNI